MSVTIGVFGDLSSIELNCIPHIECCILVKHLTHADCVYGAEQAKNDIYAEETHNEVVDSDLCDLAHILASLVVLGDEAIGEEKGAELKEHHHARGSLEQIHFETEQEQVTDYDYDGR